MGNKQYSSLNAYDKEELKLQKEFQEYARQKYKYKDFIQQEIEAIICQQPIEIKDEDYNKFKKKYARYLEDDINKIILK